jgi:hypothetical protein
VYKMIREEDGIGQPPSRYGCSTPAPPTAESMAFQVGSEVGCRLRNLHCPYSTLFTLLSNIFLDKTLSLSVLER